MAATPDPEKGSKRQFRCISPSLAHPASLRDPVVRFPRLAMAAATESNKDRPMTPRPIYLWKSFWLGILVLGLMGWAWMAFETDPVAVSHCRRKVTHVAACGGGQVTLMKWTAFDRYENNPPDGIQAGKGIIDPAPDRALFPKALQWHHRGSVYWTLQLAQWFVMLGVATPWSAFLAWRWWRQRNLTRNTP